MILGDIEASVAYLENRARLTVTYNGSSIENVDAVWLLQNHNQTGSMLGHVKVRYMDCFKTLGFSLQFRL